MTLSPEKIVNDELRLETLRRAVSKAMELPGSKEAIKVISTIAGKQPAQIIKGVAARLTGEIVSIEGQPEYDMALSAETNEHVPIEMTVGLREKSVIEVQGAEGLHTSAVSGFYQDVGNLSLALSNQSNNTL
jgi:hypothetical protein